MNSCALNNIIPLLVIIIAIPFFIIASIVAGRKRTQALKKLSGYLTGSTPKISFLPTFKGEYQGLKFSIMLMPQSRNSPSYLNILVYKNSTFKLRIYKESPLSNFGKRIGLVREVKTDDEFFDKEFLIFSNRVSSAIAYLNNINIKNSLREVFNNGFTLLAINGRFIFAQKPNYIIEVDLEPPKIINILQKLCSLTSGL